MNTFADIPLATFAVPMGTVAAAMLAFSSAVFVFWKGKQLERDSINRALLAEIHRLIRVVWSHYQWWPENTIHPVIPFTHEVYTKQVANIGLLNKEVVWRAVKFYGYIDFINHLQALRPEYEKNEKFEDFVAVYKESLESLLVHFQTDFDVYFKALGKESPLKPEERIKKKSE